MGHLDSHTKEGMIQMHELFIEAESFKDKGGWVVDTLSMETTHSSYLMAHGMGIPVEDAKTDFEISCAGTYFIWVLTRDWTAVWGMNPPAGRFNVQIDNALLENTVGTNGEKWAWQQAGKLFLSEGIHTVYLKDLTGFNGRCDALYITDSEAAPGSNISDIDNMRKRLNPEEYAEEKEIYDLVVAGGGIAGICTALSAIRSGVSTVLIHDRPVLGGCNSSEVRVCMGGHIKIPPYENLGNVVREIAPVMGSPSLYNKEYYEDSRKLFAFEASGGKYKIMLNNAVTGIEKTGNTISAVICTDTLTGRKTKIKAKLFSDCSGDGILARLGGSELMYGSESRDEFGESLGGDYHRNVVMGHSIRWYAEEQEDFSPFPDLDWNLPFDDNSYLKCTAGDWEQETGFTRDMVKEAEYIRDYGLRAVYANWSYQKNHCLDKEKYANYKLKWVSPFGGKRESFRVKGDYILTQHDLEAETDYNDGTAAVSWGIDIHFPDPANQARFKEAFRSFAYHRNMPAVCPVPYRCLYSKDIDNLFLGGRLISATHVAMSAVRVMRTLGMLGEVAGLAASLCKNHDCRPRDIYENYLDELKLLMKKGVYIPNAFECCGIGDSESYHFKDIAWWLIKDGICRDNSWELRQESKEEIEKFRYSISQVNLNHKYDLPDKWKP